jgi:hypothetical protein
MAKAIMEYNLNDPDDVKAHLRAIKSTDMAIAFFEIDQFLRSESKYNDNQIAFALREKIHNIMSNHGVDLDELID